MSYIRRDFKYSVIWDKPGTNSAQADSTTKSENFGNKVKFIQRSVYGTQTFESVERLVELVKHYGFDVLVFRIVEVPDVG